MRISTRTRFAMRRVAAVVVLAASCSVVAAEEGVEPDAADTSPWVQSADPSDPDSMVSDAASGERDPRVRVLLAPHPDRDVVICLAGCGSGPKLVAVRDRRTPIAEPGALSPAIVVAAEGAPVTAIPAAAESTPETGDVICIAGCPGGPGGVVHKGVRLTWINEDAGAEVKIALRALAERLEAGGAAAAPASRAASREWVSARGRDLLVGPPLDGVLAALVRSAAGMVGTGARTIR